MAVRTTFALQLHLEETTFSCAFCISLSLPNLCQTVRSSSLMPENNRKSTEYMGPSVSPAQSRTEAIFVEL